MSEISESAALTEDDVVLPVEELEGLDTIAIQEDLSFVYPHMAAIHTPAAATASSLGLEKT